MKRILLPAVAIVFCLIALLSFYLIGRIQPPTQPTQEWLVVESLGKPLIPSISLAEMIRSQEFTAEVESATVETRARSSRANSQLVSKPSTNPMYCTLLLRKRDGERLGIHEQNATSNSIAFVLSLERGKTYTFPSVFESWLTLHPNE